MKSNRLNLILKQIRKDERVLDLGTDHALLLIELLKKDITTNVVGSDINEGPLNIARQNLSESGFDNVKLIQSDGFENIEPKDFDTIVIAGLGTSTIRDIIKSKEFNGRYLIHSTNHLEDLRRYINEIGHMIVNEWIDKEDHIYNVIIETRLGDQKLEHKDLFLGPFLKEKPESKQYYRFILDQYESIKVKNNISDYKKKEIEWLKERI